MIDPIRLSTPWVEENPSVIHALTRLRQVAKAARIQVTNQWAEHRWAELISADPSKAVLAQEVFREAHVDPNSSIFHPFSIHFPSISSLSFAHMVSNQTFEPEATLEEGEPRS